MKLNREPLPQSAYTRAIRTLDSVYKTTTPEQAIKNCSQTASPQLDTVFKVMAHGVNIVDGITFQRTFEPRELRSVMTLGGCAGILIAQTAYEPLEMTPAEIFSSTIDVEVSEAKYAIDSHHIIARSLIEMGARGIDLAGDETDTWLEERETHLVPDVRMQRLFRTSAGIVFWMAGKAYARQLERDKMQSLREMQAAVDSA